MSESNLNHKIDVLLGFAHKARKLITGNTATEVSLRRGRLRVVVLASDASRWTVQKFARLAARNNVPAFVYGTKADFARLLGKGPVSVLGVETATFSKPLVDFLSRAPGVQRPEVVQIRKRRTESRRKTAKAKPVPPKQEEQIDYVPRNPHRRSASATARRSRRR